MNTGKTINQRYQTLSKALSIIDPEGILNPGTSEHNWTTETILSWMAGMGPEEVYRMAEAAQRIFKLKRCDWH